MSFRLRSLSSDINTNLKKYYNFTHHLAQKPALRHIPNLFKMKKNWWVGARTLILGLDNLPQLVVDKKEWQRSQLPPNSLGKNLLQFSLNDSTILLSIPMHFLSEREIVNIY